MPFESFYLSDQLAVLGPRARIDQSGGAVVLDLAVQRRDELGELALLRLAGAVQPREEAVELVPQGPVLALVRVPPQVLRGPVDFRDLLRQLLHVVLEHPDPLPQLRLHHLRGIVALVLVHEFAQLLRDAGVVEPPPKFLHAELACLPAVEGGRCGVPEGRESVEPWRQCCEPLRGTGCSCNHEQELREAERALRVEVKALEQEAELLRPRRAAPEYQGQQDLKRVDFPVAVCI
mmetsp:Transcript_119253/g.338127  ORF Transcript_119253/g.338127 Transcript_119253/m.338127 type:complete len:234 (+) Transcript_119253:680-1381(+)